MRSNGTTLNCSCIFAWCTNEIERERKRKRWPFCVTQNNLVATRTIRKKKNKPFICHVLKRISFVWKWNENNNKNIMDNGRTWTKTKNILRWKENGVVQFSVCTSRWVTGVSVKIELNDFVQMYAFVWIFKLIECKMVVATVFHRPLGRSDFLCVSFASHSSFVCMFQMQWYIVLCTGCQQQNRHVKSTHQLCCYCSCICVCVCCERVAFSPLDCIHTTLVLSIQRVRTSIHSVYGKIIRKIKQLNIPNYMSVFTPK